MSSTNSQLSQWILSNWPRKVDKRTGVGDPTTNGIVGYGIFDLYQNIKDGQVYTWTIQVEEYESDPDFIGFVDSEAEFASLLPIDTDKFVIIVKDFHVDPYKFKTGSIVTATDSILGMSGLSGRIRVEQSNGYWAEVGKGGGAEDILYTNPNPVPLKLGGVEPGTTFSEAPVSEVLDMLLYPYQYPSFTSFTIGGMSTREVGSILQESQRSVSWGISNSSNIIPTSIDLYDSTSNQLLSSDLGNSPKLIQFPSYISNAPSTQSFRIEATNTNNGTFSRSTSVSWRWRGYYGESELPSLDESEIKDLREAPLQSDLSGTYSMSTGGYKYFCWPTSFGIPSTFKDQSTNLDVAMEAPVVVTVQNSFAVSTEYNVFRTTNKLGGSITVIVS